MLFVTVVFCCLGHRGAPRRCRIVISDAVSAKVNANLTVHKCSDKSATIKVAEHLDSILPISSVGCTDVTAAHTPPGLLVDRKCVMRKL
ncbi:hypothetical protein DFJ58DRAFT_787682 [Suillus subalutaceus]|uniref:uncharacterized protein n=1 Tax=Suillus subalutaceus TaxID=48586 RepID=UPI001B87FBFA|nr:uncharacterized protein DFJ58DRAFT_787682 [Suillus subalutaceus]KAG1854831.1 hypothetical protein DFJ58DRAFT_787682 [Suillus subalutaceus]